MTTVDWRAHDTPEFQAAFADAQARLDDGDYTPGEAGTVLRQCDEALTERYDRLVLQPARVEFERSDLAPATPAPECDGLCLTGADIGIPVAGVAYAHPGCPLHDPDEVCECGNPDRCLSPTHGQISYPEALKIRNNQRPSVPPKGR